MNDQRPPCTVYPELAQRIDRWASDSDGFASPRREALQRLRSELEARNFTAELVFICTHNSRRSHLAEAWATASAAHFGRTGIACFSGGTEVTALHRQIVASLEQSGFTASEPPDGSNRSVALHFGEHCAEMMSFSKRFDALELPQREFIAVMTCSEADSGCPVVAGASARISLPYSDPKQSDGTPMMQKTYLERCEEIGREMAIVFKP